MKIQKFLQFFLIFLIFFLKNSISLSKPVDCPHSNNPPVFFHIVKKGECLYLIAKKYGISVKELKRLNHLKSNLIRPGQVLKIKKTPPPYKLNDPFLKFLAEAPLYKTHIVKKGETLYKIAKRYKVSIIALRNFNDLDSEYVPPGTVLKIPIKPPISEDLDFFVSPSFCLKKRKIYYRVKKGDSLYKIAKKYRVSVKKLKKLNGLKSNIIRPGQKLLVKIVYLKNKCESQTVRTYILHTVRKGETLSELSVKYNVPIKTIKQINHLKSDIIVIGETLKIPVTKKLEKPSGFTNPVALCNQTEETIHSKIQENIIKNTSELKPFILSNQEKEELKEKFIKIAHQYKGYRYKFGGNGKGYLDCSMFVKVVYNEFGIDLPRTAREQFRVGQKVSKKNLIPGDLVFFITRGRYPSHVGIYIGDNKFMHFCPSRKGLAIDSLNSRYFRKRYIGAKRILDERFFKYFHEFLTKMQKEIKEKGISQEASTHNSTSKKTTS